MHKLLTILFLLITTWCFSQTPSFVTRSSGVVTTIDVRSGATLNWYMPHLTDTTLAGGVDTLGGMLYVISGSLQGVWYRDSVSTGGHCWTQVSRSNQNYWTLNGTSLYPNLTTYNVGIGTTTPTHKLDVVSGTGTLFFDGTRLGLYSDIVKNNVLVGQLTGQSLSTTYSDAIFIGGSAGRFATGNFNMAIGTSALQNGNNAENTAIGYKSLNLTDSTDNTAVGYLSGLANYGAYNVSIGSSSGNYLALGNGNVNNSEIVTSSATIVGATTATFISGQSLSVGQTYAVLLHFNGTPPEPYNASGITDLYTNVTVTASNTLTLVNASNFTTQGTSTTTITVYNKQFNSIAIGYNARTIQSNQIVLGNSNNTRLQANQFIVDITDVPATGESLVWQAGGYAAWDTVTGGGGSIGTFLSPLVNTAGVVSINNAAADGSSKGAATFTASDFNASSGLISIDYTNGQAADATHKGFLTNTDWNTFNGKLSNITGLVTAGTNVTITGSGTGGSPYVINATGSGTGSVTSVTGVNANGFTWNITNPTTTPFLTIDLQLATSTLSGKLSSTDWNTFNNKQAAITGAITTVTNSNLTASRAVISNALGKIDVSTTTSTDLANFVLAHTQQTLTDGATITMNCANGYLGKVTLGGNRTLAITNNTNGYDIVIEVIQDGTGGRTLTLPSGSIVPVGFGSGTSINLSTTGGAKDIIYLKYDGTNYFVTLAKQFQ